MAEKDRVYYWLKLKRDFFKRHDIRIIEAMQNGKDYVLFYMKLLLESIDHEGMLRFSDTIPYNEDMLSTITNTNIDIVRTAIKIFRELEMMEILDDGTIYMQEIQKMIGHESYWADQKRKKRSEMPMESLNVGQCPTNVQHLSTMSNQEIEIEKEIEIDKEVVVGGGGSELKEIIKVFEQEIGMITPLVADEINGYATELPKDVIIRAIQEASMNNKRTWRYIKAILDRCIKENVRTVQDFEGRKNAKAQPSKGKPNGGKYSEVFMN
jgi:predicted phage replisome organizer